MTFKGFCGGGGGGSRRPYGYGREDRGKNLPIFKLQRLECLLVK